MKAIDHTVISSMIFIDQTNISIAMRRNIGAASVVWATRPRFDSL